MEHIKSLEITRLFKKLQFVESDYLYQSELIETQHEKFYQNVDEFLENFPDLKEIFEEKNNTSTIEIIKDVQIIKENDPDEEDVIIKDPELKKMFRQVVKNTHPDKVTNSKLNRLYLRANKAYEDNDISTMVQVCSELEIDINYDRYFEKIESMIKIYQSKMKFLKNTYTYKWLKSEKSEDRNKIVLEFIKSKVK